MPMICSAADTLTIKEVREAGPGLADEMAVSWEFTTCLAAAAGGAEIVCVRHPQTVGLLKRAFADLMPEGNAGGP
jgi:acetyl-CoA decarbonylase/synthase complex subunit delta